MVSSLNSFKRREQITTRLGNSTEPVSASVLAGELEVSRQVIVGDIALLRASGLSILATPRGYVLPQPEEGGIVRTIACKHGTLSTAEELYRITDNGGAVLDVIVEHPVYGQITAPLQIRSRYDADRLVESLAHHKAQPLSLLTDGVHLHTIRCKDETTFQRILQALQDGGLLFSVS